MTMTDDLRAIADDDLASLAPAQRLWLRAAEIGPRPDPTDALDLVRLAGSDPSLLRHALVLGRADGQADPDAAAAGALAALESALALVAGRDRAA